MANNSWVWRINKNRNGSHWLMPKNAFDASIQDWLVMFDIGLFWFVMINIVWSWSILGDSNQQSITIISRNQFSRGGLLNHPQNFQVLFCNHPICRHTMAIHMPRNMYTYIHHHHHHQENKCFPFIHLVKHLWGIRYYQKLPLFSGRLALHKSVHRCIPNYQRRPCM